MQAQKFKEKMLTRQIEENRVLKQELDDLRDKN